MAEARLDIAAIADLAEIDLQILEVTIIGDRIFTKLYLLGQRFLFLGIVFELFGKLAEKGFVLAGIAA